MKVFKEILVKVSKIRFLKYFVVLAVAIVFVGFLDENSAWNHIRNRDRISELEAEIARYKREYERDLRQLKTLGKDPKAVERIARERYFMKAEDEDIYVLDIRSK